MNVQSNGQLMKSPKLMNMRNKLSTIVFNASNLQANVKKSPNWSPKQKNSRNMAHLNNLPTPDVSFERTQTSPTTVEPQQIPHDGYKSLMSISPQDVTQNFNFFDPQSK